MIGQYAAYVSTEGLFFPTEDAQRAQVQSLIQANLDLEIEYLKLKRAIEHTNLMTVVTINGKTYSISDIISIRRIVGQFRTASYGALNGQKAMEVMRRAYGGQGGKQVEATNPPKVVMLYDEADKNAQLKDWSEFLEAIDGRMEVVNAETELLGY
jgi:hypothetical protein